MYSYREPLKNNFNTSLIDHFIKVKRQDSLEKLRLLIANIALGHQELSWEKIFTKENAVATGTKTVTRDTGKRITTTTVFVPNGKLSAIHDKINMNARKIETNNARIITLDSLMDIKQGELFKKMKPDKKGFLNELDLLFTFIFLQSSSKIPMMVWLFFILFFTGIDLFVLLAKSGKNKKRL